MASKKFDIVLPLAFESLLSLLMLIMDNVKQFYKVTLAYTV
jgi:hypothetical protein